MLLGETLSNIKQIIDKQRVKKDSHNFITWIWYCSNRKGLLSSSTISSTSLFNIASFIMKSYFPNQIHTISWFPILYKTNCFENHFSLPLNITFNMKKITTSIYFQTIMFIPSVFGGLQTGGYPKRAERIQSKADIGIFNFHNHLSRQVLLLFLYSRQREWASEKVSIVQ